MLEILDSLIATITFVLILSLIVQSIQQIMKQLFNMKSKFMERELFAMFASVAYKRSLWPVKWQYEKLAAQHVMESRLVREISKRLSGVGYDDLSQIESIGKEKFLSLLGDLLDTGEIEAVELKSLTAEEKENTLREIDFRQKARLDVHKWFDGTMSAFRDHYERRMKMWAFGLGAVVVVWLNAIFLKSIRSSREAGC